MLASESGYCSWSARRSLAARHPVPADQGPHRRSVHRRQPDPAGVCVGIPWIV